MRIRKSADVIIAGAGIMGLHTAFQLKRRAPELGVRVLERARAVGQGSTGFSSAVLRCRYTLPSMVDVAAEGLKIHNNWSDYLELPRPLASFTQHPILWVMPETTYQQDVQRLARHGLNTTVYYSADEVGERFPALDFSQDERTGVVQYFVEEDGGYFDPTAALTDLLTACRNIGVEVMFNTEIERVHVMDDSTIELVKLSTGDSVPCGALVNCTGPWHDKLNDIVGWDNDWDIQPARIQVVHKPLVKQDPAAEDIPAVCDAVNGVYFRPHLQGDHIIISTVRPQDEEERVEEPDDFNTAADPEVRQRYLSSLHARIPGLTPRGTVAGYSALYTVNYADSHPVVGRVHPFTNYLVANGFTGHGFKLSPVVGAALAQAITGSTTRHFDTRTDWAFLSPNRNPITAHRQGVLS